MVSRTSISSQSILEGMMSTLVLQKTTDGIFFGDSKIGSNVMDAIENYRVK
jgi:hypothetical protein